MAELPLRTPISFYTNIYGMVYVGNLWTHYGIKNSWGLDDTFVRGCWTKDGEIFIETCEHEYTCKCALLSKYVTRENLLNSITVGKGVDSTTIYYKNGKVHRDGGPAIISPGFQGWYKEGKVHREDGPALIEGSLKEWYIDDQFIKSQED